MIRRTLIAAIGLALRAPAAAPQEAARAAAGAGPSDTSRVVSDSLWSNALGVRKRFLVVLPAGYDASDRRYPAAYYLHGMWGDETNWLRAGRIRESLDSLVAAGMPPMILVLPDGDDSWYTTWNALGNRADCERDTTRREPAATYCVPWPHYDDYIARELVARVDERYRTIPRRESRGIAGLSMGGYGALTLAMRYGGVFAAAASHSGVVAPLRADTGAAPAERWPARARFYGGIMPALALAFGRDTIGWAARDPARLARRARSGRDPVPAVWIDCGIADRYVGQNRALHAELRRLGIAHQYHERPGAHTWDYWRANAPRSLSWLARTLAR